MSLAPRRQCLHPLDAGDCWGDTDVTEEGLTKAILPKSVDAQDSRKQRSVRTFRRICEAASDRFGLAHVRHDAR